jgi:hypothetical protein
MAVPHDAVAAVGQLQVLPLGDEGIGIGNQHLRQHSPSAFTCDFGQWIIDRFRLTERDDGGISRHGVSLLSGGSGRLDTRLDTPPSIKRRHPDSRIARGRARLGFRALCRPAALWACGQRKRVAHKPHRHYNSKKSRQLMCYKTRTLRTPMRSIACSAASRCAKAGCRRISLRRGRSSVVRAGKMKSRARAASN